MRRDTNTTLLSVISYQLSSLSTWTSVTCRVHLFLPEEFPSVSGKVHQLTWIQCLLSWELLYFVFRFEGFLIGFSVGSFIFVALGFLNTPVTVFCCYCFLSWFFWEARITWLGFPWEQQLIFLMQLSWFCLLLRPLLLLLWCYAFADLCDYAFLGKVWSFWGCGL